MTSIHAASFHVDYDDRDISVRNPVILREYDDHYPSGGSNEHVLVEFDCLRSSRPMTSEEKRNKPREAFPAVAVPPTAGRGTAEIYRFDAAGETEAWIELRSAGLVS